MVVMRRFWALLILVVLLACRTLTPAGLISLAPSPVPQPSVTMVPSITPLPSPSFAPSPFPPVVSPLPSTPAPPLPEAPASQPFEVHLHPDGPLYVGDRVSLEVVAPPDANLKGQKAEARVDGAQGTLLGPVDFANYGIGARLQATMLWAWDTSGLEPGPHTLTFSVLPDGPTWSETVSLHPQSDVPPPEPGAHWATAESECCILHYITGTEAERDLPALMEMADQQARDVSQKMGTEIKDKLPITFLPRVLGQGGFTSDEIAVSYLDRNYAGGEPAIVLHHEMVHLLDGRLGGDLRPTMLIEGLAVYLSGGHFKPEALMPRAAALLPPAEDCRNACGLDLYIPLATLADNFYSMQHEIGYLESSALVQYMVETWGWQAFSDFYRHIHPQTNGSQAQAINVALQSHFGLTLDELEKRFQDRLRQEALTPETVNDVRLTIDFYDTVRRYQQALDPSAYFLTAWLPEASQMQAKGIVADYLRHPSAPENVALETLLVAADAALRAGDYLRVQQLLSAVNIDLDILTHSGQEALSLPYYVQNTVW
jgi:hypothetical protein